MSEKAIEKLRKRFIMTAMFALVATMIIIGGTIYLASSIFTRYAINLTLDYIIELGGDVPELTGSASQQRGIFSSSEDFNSPEFRYSVRFFAVLYDKNGNVSEIKTSHIAAVSDEEAAEYGSWARKKTFSFGRNGDYFYKYKENDDGSGIVVYLDSRNEVAGLNRIFRISIVLILFGAVIIYIIVSALSHRAIRSEVEAAELQKAFITNASHELKTPLAVIKANTEMSEMLDGETEWTQSTLRQVDRMNGLIKNLVMISRAEEGEKETVDVDISAVVRETVDTFKAVALQDGKSIGEEVEDGIRMHAGEAGIRQLVTLLMDNAIKYCDEGGEIKAELRGKGKGVLLSVSNSYAEGEGVDYTKFFERFYRQDKSHNVDKGGYGIGLSIAESLVKQYKGSIDVSYRNGVICFTAFLKPLK